MKGHPVSRQSGYIIAAAIVKFYKDKKLFPRGLHEQMECVEIWSLRMGEAIKKMVSRIKSVIAAVSV